MQSIKPYFFRAVYDWAIDNGFTPQLLVDATVDGVIAPTEYIADGHITLNIHGRAVSGLTMDNDIVAFAARFSGRSVEVRVPMNAVLAIYARENSRGIYFKSGHEESALTMRGDTAPSASSVRSSRTPSLVAKPAKTKTKAKAKTTVAAASVAKHVTPRRPPYLKLVKNPRLRTTKSGS